MSVLCLYDAIYWLYREYVEEQIISVLEYLTRTPVQGQSCAIVPLRHSPRLCGCIEMNDIGIYPELISSSCVEQPLSPCHFSLRLDGDFDVDVDVIRIY